jgi:small subunit ribosomal protein S25e
MKYFENAEIRTLEGREKNMGGTKKKPISQADKSQSAAQAELEGTQKKPEKRSAKETKLAAQQAKQQALVMPKLDEKQLLKTLAPLKAITLYATSRALNVNAAIASQLLRNLESKNILRRVGGYSGHYIYALNQPTS